ncbi:hypothetical protein ABL78_5716 [Leptomonas seymouri]|uniref:Uncharacterized protein n=1 Tax=Leptomonas seymouri TaxID=5684 RepID=A0A0N1PDC4_LEPSE|nr:hypothetical protein ABL78_5716 [Leptomonas seymouri]|eukprot:KPI85233.1 hypothetical protein ABL78_5716 [Leptomonas seymouri]
MEHCRRSGGLGGPSWTTPAIPACQGRLVDNHSDSQAPTGTNALASATDSTAHTQSIAFATPDHGVVSVNLTDLRNALGVRRGDMMPQRLTFQAQSAPSHRTVRSLLSSSFGSSGLLGVRAAAASAASPTANAHSDSNSSRTHGVSTANTDSISDVAAIPPLAHRPAQYRCRHGTLRGTQLADDPLALPAGFAQPPDLPPVSPTASSSPSQSALLSHGTPPLGCGNALRCALAGHRLSAPFMAGSVPSPLRRSGGFLSRTGTAFPVPLHTSNRCTASKSCGSGLREERADDGEFTHDSDNDNEGKGLLTPSRQHDAAAQPAEAHKGNPVSISGETICSSTAASRCSGTPSLLPPALLVDDTPADPAERGSSKSPSRSVHFAEDVVESISVARGEDEYMRLLIMYSRPWYAYVLLTASGFSLGLAFLSNLYLERGQTLVRDRAISVPFVYFLITGFGTVGMLLHLVAVWRPGGEEEQNFFENSEKLGQLPLLWVVGLLFIGGLTTSLVFSHTIGSTLVVVLVIGLVGHLVVEWAHGGADEGGDCITVWDVVGCAVTCFGALLAAASGVMEQLLAGRNRGNGAHSRLQDDLLVLFAWGVSVLVSGVCCTFFMRRLREMSQHVSQQFLLTSSLAVCTAALGIATYMADAMLSSDARAQTAGAVNDPPVGVQSTGLVADWTANLWRGIPKVLVPCYSFFPDLAILLGGGLCFLFCWYAYHMVSFYVDHIAGVACMIIGATLSTVPLTVLLALHAWSAAKPELGAATLVLSLVGALALVLGAGMVVYGGVKYRREAEIRIVIE